MHSRTKLSLGLTVLTALTAVLTACELRRNRITGVDDPVAQVIAVPDTITLDPFETHQFRAFGRTAAGDSVPVAVRWSTSAGTITQSGMYTADTSAADAVVTATLSSSTLNAASRVRKRRLVEVVVSPDSATLLAGGSRQFTVYGRNNTGDSVSVSVTFTATGGTISGSGVYTAGQTPGNYGVIAKVNGSSLSDTSAVTITTVPVASVAVTPATASVAPGQTVQLTATPMDGSGNPLSGRVVTWATSNAAVATVSGSGLVTGATAGSATVTATSEGQSGTAAITVTAAPPATGECAAPQPGWIWCDDFEQDRLASYFEYDNAAGNFVRSAGVGVSGSIGMRARFATVGQTSAGALHLAFGKTPQAYFRPVDAGTAVYRDVYWRMYVLNQPGWTGGGADKLSRATSFASSTSWAQAMIAHVWSGSAPNQNYLLIDPASGTDASGNLVTTTYNDFANLRWLGAAQGVTPLFDASHVGQWYCVEAHAKLNDATLSNGVFELWINGAVEAQRAGLNWVGSFSAYGINAVFFENYWNAGAPQPEERYFDNVVVSTQRIGCLGSPPPPPPPPASVAAVTVSPAVLSLPTGLSSQLTATLTDANGNLLTGRAVAWTSGAPAVAVVDGTGRVSALGTGSATITATSEGVAGSAIVGVTDPPSGGGATWPNQPAGFTAITERLFDAAVEDGWLASTSLAIVADATAPKSPSAVGQMTYPAGTMGGGAGSDPGYAERYIAGLGYQRVYLSMWVKLSANWQGNLTSVNKVAYINVHDKPVVFPIVQGIGSGRLRTAIGLQDIPIVGAQYMEPNLTDVEIVRGQWHRWEVVLVVNSGDAADGELHWWIDGVKVGEYRNILYGTSAQGKIWQYLYWRPIWGGQGDVLLQTQYMWMDHFYASGSP